MGILGTIERCLHSIQFDIISDRTVYAELDKSNYEQLLVEIEQQINAGIEMSVELQKTVKDFGKCSVLNYMGYKIIISENNQKKDKDAYFYFAFKTKVI